MEADLSAIGVGLNAVGIGLSAIGAGLAIGLSALATAIVQAKVGSVAVAAIQEKRELTGIMILLIAIPETMVILGFVVAVLIIYT